MEMYDLNMLAGKLMQAAYIIMKVMEFFDCDTNQRITLDEIHISFYLEDSDDVSLVKEFLDNNVPMYYQEMKIDKTYPPSLELFL